MNELYRMLVKKKWIKFFLMGIGIQVLPLYKAVSQQDPTFSMYMFNNQYFNPAYAGTVEFITASLFYRNQWVSMPGAPVTENFTAILPFQRQHISMAMNATSDKIGLTGTLNMNLAFAYYINMKTGRLSFGLDAGFQQYSLNNGVQNQLENANDNAFKGTNKLAPNFNFGVYYKSLKYYVGFSTMHLNDPSRNLSPVKITNSPSSTSRHYYLTAGYTIEIDEKFKLTPSILSSYSESKLFNNNFSTDFSFKLEYMETVWFGTTYRSSDALSFFTGVNVGRLSPDTFKENIKIGYAFDYSVSRLPSYNGGTHEIFLSYEFSPKVKRAMPKFK